MRMVYKRNGFFIFALMLAPTIALAALTPDAAPSAGSLTGVFGDIFGSSGEGAEQMCTSKSYSKPDLKAACQTCKGAVEKWKKKAAEVAKKSGAADGAASLLGGLGIKSATDFAEDAATSLGGSSAATAAGRKAAENRSKIADGAKVEFEQCRTEINEKCTKSSMSDSDKKPVASVLKACQDAGNAAGKFADQKKKDGLDMGDLSKAMGLAQAAMAAIPKQQPEGASDIGGTSPTPASVAAAKAPEITVSKMGQDSTASPVVGFGGSSTGPQVAGVAAGAVGSGLSGASSSGEGYEFPGNGSSHSGSSSGESGSAVGAGGGGLGGSGSEGSRRAASTADDTSHADPGFEFSGAGSRPMVGLKASKSDIDNVADGAVLDSDAKLEEFDDRAPASEETAGAQDAMDSADSIFARVRNKYELLKGAGRI